MIVGILAAGQLGRMIALAGYPLGLQFRFLEPKAEAPAARLGESIQAPYDDMDALAKFAEGLSVATYEFENVPAEAAEFLTDHVPFYPPSSVLGASQDRLEEKFLFQKLGISTPPFLAVDSKDDLQEAVKTIGVPGVLKTRRMGYDGKGQWVIRDPKDAGPAWEQATGAALIYEAFVPFERETSIVAARNRSGETVFYPLVENHHREGILRVTRAPAPNITDELQAEAERCAQLIMDAFEYAGVLTIEFFQHEGKLLANEMAARVHNSGHWTIDGAVTSQFENHLRGILNMPLGETTPIGHSIMLNLIGSAPPREAVLAVPGAHLHLYDKAPRPGRKIGHITLCDENPHTLEQRAAALQPFVEGSVCKSTSVHA
ncbi:MAG: 5-(carboxyamino)imidazole ribonucleotide synthase [Candidatus Hinthialibacter antarcticus]|nr:5-(carboxyamino)imidazole ribonucleotide synthase [Candidatus Hinthialibacter antarcticus]